MKDKGISWTGWCYSQTWGPTMLTSENPENRNASGNLMYKACHDTVAVVQVAIKHATAGSISAHPIAINGSVIRFTCAESSPVTVSLYALSGRFVQKVLDRTLPKGAHSIRWDAPDNSGTSVAPGLYAVRLKIKDREFHVVVNVDR
jgi:hypothetical protein